MVPMKWRRFRSQEYEWQRLLQDGQYVAWMAGLLRFARPLNCLMSAVGVGIGGVVGVGSAVWGDLALPLGLAAAAAAAFTAGGNALNDISDIETDRVNHPDRPLASGQLTLGTARAFAASAFAIAAVRAGTRIPFGLRLIGPPRSRTR